MDSTDPRESGASVKITEEKITFTGGTLELREPSNTDYFRLLTTPAEDKIGIMPVAGYLATGDDYKLKGDSIRCPEFIESLDIPGELGVRFPVEYDKQEGMFVVTLNQISNQTTKSEMVSLIGDRFGIDCYSQSQLNTPQLMEIFDVESEAALVHALEKSAVPSGEFTVSLSVNVNKNGVAEILNNVEPPE